MLAESPNSRDLGCNAQLGVKNWSRQGSRKSSISAWFAAARQAMRLPEFPPRLLCNFCTGTIGTIPFFYQFGLFHHLAQDFRWYSGCWDQVAFWKAKPLPTSWANDLNRHARRQIRKLVISGIVIAYAVWTTNNWHVNPRNENQGSFVTS